jgi:endonuclease-3
MPLSRTAPAPERAPEILKRLKKAYPEATVALRFSNPLELLIATILSAQCTDARVNQVTETLFQKYRKAEDYLKVPEAELAADIKPTGFFNQKTRSVRGTCRKLVEEFGGEVPDTMEELITLPGVARKTANVVLGSAFGKVEGIAVDTHVRRLSQRFGFSSSDDPVQVERDLMALFPKRQWTELTYRIIDHGRLTCVARKPRCGECPVEDLCPSSQA